jgi:hypothetical protein
MLLGLTRAALPCLLAAVLSAADNPFVGQWKLNIDRTRMNGQTQTVRDLGGNKYEFDNGAVSYTIVANGTDQPLPSGITMSLKPEGDHSWIAVRKKDGRVLSESQWTITSDGKTWISRTKGIRLNGAKFSNQVTSARVSGGPGLTGTWELEKVAVTAPPIWEIQSCDENGVTFLYPASKGKLDLKFNGKEYSEEGPLADKNVSYSGKRLGPNAFEVTSKREGKTLDRTEYALAPDGKTLTETVHNTGQKAPLVVVFERQ